MFRSTKDRRQAVVFVIGASVLLIVALYAITQAEEEIERQQQIAIENERVKTEMGKTIEELKEQLTQIEQENQMLKTVLINRNSMNKIVVGHVDSQYLLDRGARTGTLAQMSLTTPSGFTAAAFERAFADLPGMKGLEGILIEMEEEWGINAVILAGIIALESGWGNSYIAQTKNNLAGLGASTGPAAFHFDTREDSVRFLAELLAVKYSPDGKYFGGSFTLTGVNVRYAEDTQWAAKVARCATHIVRAAVPDSYELSSAAAKLKEGNDED